MNKKGSLKTLIKQKSNILVTDNGSDINISLSKKKVSKKSKISKDSETSDSIDNSEYNSTNININELIYPCKDIILYTKVGINPHQMNNDLYINLKKNLIDKYEGKCITEGYVIKIYKILEYSNGVITPENFSGNAVYNVKYMAKVCVALKDTTIIGKITKYIPNANFALVEFGNIIKIIFTKNKRDLNVNKFTIDNDKSIVHIETQKKLDVNDYVKIQLKTIKFYHNDNSIKCMGFLDDIPTVEEISKYNYNDIEIKEQKQEIISTIYYNEENEILDENVNEIKSNIKSNIMSI